LIADVVRHQVQFIHPAFLFPATPFGQSLPKPVFVLILTGSGRTVIKGLADTQQFTTRKEHRRN
jgi:hypothetical protein